MAEGVERLRAGGARLPRSRPGRIGLALVVVFVAAAVVAVAVPLIGRVTGASGESRSQEVSVMHFACFQAAADNYCQRLGEDMARRVPLSANLRAETEASRQRVLAVLPPAEGGQPSCGVPGHRCTPVSATLTAEQVRQALNAAGYQEVVVRLALASDPAPVGSLLLAVPVGAACVVAYVERGGLPTGRVAGRLRDGGCLAG